MIICNGRFRSPLTLCLLHVLHHWSSKSKSSSCCFLNPARKSGANRLRALIRSLTLSRRASRHQKYGDVREAPGRLSIVLNHDSLFALYLRKVSEWHFVSVAVTISPLGALHSAIGARLKTAFGSTIERGRLFERRSDRKVECLDRNRALFASYTRGVGIVLLFGMYRLGFRSSVYIIGAFTK